MQKQAFCSLLVAKYEVSVFRENASKNERQNEFQNNIQIKLLGVQRSDFLVLGVFLRGLFFDLLLIGKQIDKTLKDRDGDEKQNDPPP